MRCNKAAVFSGGAVIGTVGGLIGLGGAEFRLPLLIGAFEFPVLEAVIVNKAASLVVVASALPFRAAAVPLREVAVHWPIVLNLLAGSLVGAWLGAGWATKLKSATLFRVIAILLVSIAALLVLGHDLDAGGQPFASGGLQFIAGVAAGFVIGVVASLLGVAGGELLIPALVLLFGVDIKLAGSLSLAVSLPTMIVGFTRYSRDRSFAVLRQSRTFVLVMAFGSIVGTFVGGRLLGIIPGPILLPLLATILVISAVKVWRHKSAST
ncbi:MAG: sulfite exporter TauE/SafE family protein [Methylocystis sp.]